MSKDNPRRLLGKEFYRYDTGKKQSYPLRKGEVYIGIARHLLGYL